MKRKKFIEERNSEFIIVNEFCQVFSGLKSGYPFFQDDWKLAKPLQRMSQFDKIKRGTLDKLEILYLK